MASWITKGKRSAELLPCVPEWIACPHSPQGSWPRPSPTHLGSLAKASSYEESDFSRSCNVVARSVATSPPIATHCSRRPMSQHATVCLLFPASPRSSSNASGSRCSTRRRKCKVSALVHSKLGCLRMWSTRSGRESKVLSQHQSGQG